MTPDLRERFEAKVSPDPMSGCLLWIGSYGWGRGYGVITQGGKRRGAHRVAWELTRGPIPEGLCVLHRCDVPGCVNVEHLFIGTRDDNNRDMTSKGRRKNGVSSYRLTGRCSRGHTPEFITLRKNGNGRVVRSCRECERIRGRKRRLRDGDRIRDQDRVRYAAKKFLGADGIVRKWYPGTDEP